MENRWEKLMNLLKNFLFTAWALLILGIFFGGIYSTATDFAGQPIIYIIIYILIWITATLILVFVFAIMLAMDSVVVNVLFSIALYFLMVGIICLIAKGWDLERFIFPALGIGTAALTAVIVVIYHHMKDGSFDIHEIFNFLRRGKREKSQSQDKKQYGVLDDDDEFSFKPYTLKQLQEKIEARAEVWGKGNTEGCHTISEFLIMVHDEMYTKTWPFLYGYKFYMDVFKLSGIPENKRDIQYWALATEKNYEFFIAVVNMNNADKSQEYLHVKMPQTYAEYVQQFKAETLKPYTEQIVENSAKIGNR